MFFAPVFQTSDVRKCSIVMVWKARRNNEKVRISDHAFLPIKFLFFFFCFLSDSVDIVACVRAFAFCSSLLFACVN